MKYPQSVLMPRDVEDWLECELEARGIDAVVYTRYILSLLQKDPLNPCDLLPNLQSKTVGWSGSKCKGSDWPSWDDEALRRLAVIQCLMSASDQKCDIETLVDELCAKLKEIQGSAVDESSSFPKRYESPPFTDYNAAFPPLRGGVGKGSTNSTWTRGILRASLDRTDTLSYDDIINAEDCFSLMYCGSQKMFGPLDGLLSEKAPGRLYERAADRGLNHIINKLDPTIDDWKPDYVTPTNVHPTELDQDQYYFFNCHSLFSPTIFGFGRLSDEPTVPQTTWSLGGSATTLSNHWQNGSCFKEVAPGGAVDGVRSEPRVPPVPVNEEEDLLTSARTHFRPIRSEDSGHLPSYADGTTFAISTELEELPFKRSESGTLFLETGKYMEYKKEELGEEGGSPEFVPKFRVRQSNEKFCQTEDVIEIQDDERSIPSPETSVSDPDEFFFPGDDELAQDINTEQNITAGDIAIAEDKLATAENVLGMEDILEYPLQSSDAKLEIDELESNWDADDAALVDGLVNEDGSWKTPPDGNNKCPHPESDDAMDSLDANGGTESDSDKVPSAWPPLTESIWNPLNPTQLCGSCKSQSVCNNVTSENKLRKNEWQDIWGPSLCDDCRDDESTVTTEIFDSGVGWTCDQRYIPDVEPWAYYESLHKTNRNEEEDDEDTDDWDALDANENVDWSAFGPVGLDKKFKKPSSDCRFPKLGVALSAYLEERRVRALELLDHWSPVVGSEEECLVKKSNEFRDLWSPVIIPDEESGIRLPNQEWREIWSPAQGLRYNGETRNMRPPNYSQLREELSEDGDQLLSDLSCLHLQQLGSTDATDNSDFLEDDSFPTAPPSPTWEKGNRSIQLWGTWSICDVIADCHKQDERNYNPETAQKERKRRNSSSQKVCDLYMEGECRRPHCRFLHCDAAIPCPFFDDASCTRGDACPLSHVSRSGREPQRAFTL